MNFMQPLRPNTTASTAGAEAGVADERTLRRREPGVAGGPTDLMRLRRTFDIALPFSEMETLNRRSAGKYLFSST
jgi:hypothetical protein